jgi:hypothetical protein
VTDGVTQLEPVDGHDVLEKLGRLPVSSWSYNWEDPAKVRHLGPMAQDFMAAFGLGDDDRKIAFIDANGVLTVAVQALYRRVIALEEEVRALKGSGPEGVAPKAGDRLAPGSPARASTSLDRSHRQPVEPTRREA